MEKIGMTNPVAEVMQRTGLRRGETEMRRRGEEESFISKHSLDIMPSAKQIFLIVKNA